MPRANRHHIPGFVWHITHQYHKIVAIGFILLIGFLDPANIMAREMLVLNYSFPFPGLSEADGFTVVRMTGLPSYHQAAEPLLPFQSARILIPSGYRVETVKSEEGQEIFIEGFYRVEPAQASVRISSPAGGRKTEPDSSIYNSYSPYPEKVISDINIQVKKGYHILCFNLFPVKYIPAEGKLSYFKSITVRVELTPAFKSATQLVPRQSVPGDKDEIIRLVDNPQVISSYRLSEPSSEMSSRLSARNHYQQVIITSPSLAGSFAPLVKHRIARWTTSTVVDIGWIYSHYNGVDNQEKIRGFIRDAYINWETDFVLLGGDKDVLPPRMLYVEGWDNGALSPGRSGITSPVPSATPIQKMPLGSPGNNPNRALLTSPTSSPTPTGFLNAEMPSDIYYSNLDGPFNYNGNNKWGEPDDGTGGGDIDLLSEVWVGRFPVSSADEVYFMVNKILAYENDITGYINRVTMLGEYLGFGGVSEFAKPYLEEVRLGSDAYYYTSTGFASNPWFDTSENLYDEDDYPVQWLANPDLFDLLNSGVALINHLGHGGTYSGWRMNTTTLLQLENDLAFFGYTQACNCGGFDYADCWAEVISTIEHGALGIVANARYGFGEQNGTDGPSQRYAREFWDALLGEDIRALGKMNADSKEDLITRINEDNMRWCFYETNLFADPVVQVRVEFLPSPTPTPIGFHTPSPPPTATTTSTPSPYPSSTPSPTPTPSVTPGSTPLATLTPTPSVTLTPSITPTPSPGSQAPLWIYDYNGDGTSDIAIFRESASLWAVRGVTRVYFGSSIDETVPGDYNGDGTTEIGIFRASSGLWAIRGVTRVYFGRGGDSPEPGDYNGDGTWTIGLFRSSSGLWAIQGVTRVYFGGVADSPASGYYDGEATKDIGIFRGSSGLWAIRNVTRIYFGSSLDTIVPGDYDGDGTWETGIFRETSGLWAIRGVTRIYFGSSIDEPVPADYTGDAMDDIGIFRDSSGLWAIRGVSRVYFGTSGDVPVTR